MDRNTITALLLITLVLVLTPYYLDFLSPTQPENEIIEEGLFEEPERELSTLNPNTKEPAFSIDLLEQKTTEEIITTIETDIYIAKISSVGGGSVLSYKIKEHLSPDGDFVNLIYPNNMENLFIKFRNIDGEIISLKKGWSQKTTVGSIYLSEPQSISYTNLVAGKRVTKTITLYPDNFIIDIDLDLTELSKDILGNVFSFNWVGGLPTTEKDTITDKVSFGAYLYQGGELLDIKVGSGENFENEYKGQTDWVSTRTKYFVAALLENGTNRISGATISASNSTQELYDISVELSSKTDANISLYLGPLEYDRIKSLNVKLESIMDFGWAIIRPISKGVLWTLKTMNKYIPNYGVIVIIFSVLIKLLVYPLTKKSYQSSRAMQEIQPELTELRDKHKNNPTKLNKVTMELYKKRGVNPFGACLPMLLQMPLLFSLFQVFRSTIELRGEPFIFWIKDLSAPDVIFYLPFKIPIYGDYVCALPILMALSMFVQQKMMSPGGPQQDQQKLMQYFMMVFFFLLFNSFPSGLNLYYTLFNVLTIAQQKLTGQTNQPVPKPSP